MNITNLSKFGRKLDNIFELDLLTEIVNLSKKFSTMYIRNGDQGEYGSPRETYVITADSEIGNKIINYLTPVFLTISEEHNKKVLFKIIELWRDYPGYNNSWHYDDPGVENFCIVYLDNGPGKLGTQYQEDNEVFSVSYKKNSAIVLLNSNLLEHGMIGGVPADMVRRTLYINWKIISE